MQLPANIEISPTGAHSRGHGGENSGPGSLRSSLQSVAVDYHQCTLIPDGLNFAYKHHPQRSLGDCQARNRDRERVMTG